MSKCVYKYFDKCNQLKPPPYHSSLYREYSYI